MVATFFLQRTTAFILFLIVPSLQISCFRKTKEKQYAKYDLNKRTAARLIWQLVIHRCVIFAYIISRLDGENNGLLAGASLPLSSRAPSVSLAPETPFPFLFKRLPRRLLLWQRNLLHSISKLRILAVPCCYWNFTFKVGTFHTILHPPYQAPARPRPTISGPNLPYQEPRILSYNQRQKYLGRLYNLTVVHFNPEKREFSLLLNIPRPPCSMLGYNRTITRTNINVLINIGPGAGGGRKRRDKKGNLPNTFDVFWRRFYWQKVVEFWPFTVTPRIFRQSKTKVLGKAVQLNSSPF